MKAAFIFPRFERYNLDFFRKIISLKVSIQIIIG